MVGHKITPADEGSYLRKLRKPMIEKRRRERINTSIDHLKKILTKSRPEIDSETKLDKAEILEMTVNHLTKEQRKPATSDTYNRGFDDCARETVHFLASRGIVDLEVLSRLSAHLQSVSGKPQQQLTVPVAMETRCRQHQRFCSTPQSHMLPSYPENVSIATTPSLSNSYLHSFTSSSSEDSYSVSTGSDISLLGNIISDEKPWRPW